MTGTTEGPTNEQLSKALAELKEGSVVESAQVETVNDQIQANEGAIRLNETRIEGYRNAIRAHQKANRNIRAENTKLRRQRSVYSRAAWELKEINQP